MDFYKYLESGKFKNLDYNDDDTYMGIVNIILNLPYREDAWDFNFVKENLTGDNTHEWMESAEYFLKNKDNLKFFENQIHME